MNFNGLQENGDPEFWSIWTRWAYWVAWLSYTFTKIIIKWINFIFRSILRRCSNTKYLFIHKIPKINNCLKFIFKINKWRSFFSQRDKLVFTLIAKSDNIIHNLNILSLANQLSNLLIMIINTSPPIFDPWWKTDSLTIIVKGKSHSIESAVAGKFENIVV